MATIKITYEYNNETGKREIHIDYRSDPDALAYEHEKEHARIVRELIGKGILAPEEADDVIIDRPDEKVPSGKPEQKEEVPLPQERKGNTN